MGAPGFVRATPANKSALARHYDRFLSKHLNNCATCHLPSVNQDPESLAEFPHNPFGDRLRVLGEDLAKSGNARSIPTRLGLIAGEDSDGDGIANEAELLLGRSPGDPGDKPSASEQARLKLRRGEFEKFLLHYPWRPFEGVERPPVPAIKNRRWLRNPIDGFIAAEHSARGLVVRPEAPKEILLRRIYLDLIGLSPTPAEMDAFLRDHSTDAYEKVVDRLLHDPRYGERWARHWMDIWRYSDWAGWTDGGQIRDSQPHIWRWRDWIVESLNANKGYDRMLLEMLAADEMTPDDANALRATGFLVRNYKMLSREQWLEDTLKHSGQAFLGLTLGCAKCHDHMSDPISQKEYYHLRAVFEPHWVRIDRVPGETNTAIDGLARVFDTDTNPPTYFFYRGDERHPDTNSVLAPRLPKLFGDSLQVRPVALSRNASLPDQRDFVVRDVVAASEKAIREARHLWEQAQTNTTFNSARKKEAEISLAVVEAKHQALQAVLGAEKLEAAGNKDGAEWRTAAKRANTAQRELARRVAESRLHQARQEEVSAQTKLDEAKNAIKSSSGSGADKPSEERSPTNEELERVTKDLESAKKKRLEAETTLVAAEKAALEEPVAAYEPRPMAKYPSTSTGRRLAFARWLTSEKNPLTARVAANHIWARHFGQGLLPTPADFGGGGKPPSHPALLDWLAAELMQPSASVETLNRSAVAPDHASTPQRFSALTPGPWSLKHLHRLIATSSTYRMASTPDSANAATDPDNVWFWRMNSRRMEAELVRDNILYVAGALDLTMGGPDIDHKNALTSKRRSIYLRCAQEKQPEFMKIFDGPSVVECYERKPTVMPQQALALINSEVVLAQAKALARKLMDEARGDEDFIGRAYRRVLARRPTFSETRLCQDFLASDGGAQANKTPLIRTAAKSERPGVSSDHAVRARENLLLVLFNHNDFVTVR